VPVLRASCGFLCVLACAPAPAAAHDPGLSSSRVVVRDRTIEIEAVFDRADLAGIALRDGVAVEIDGAAAAIECSEVAPADEADDLCMRLTLARPPGAAVRVEWLLLERLPRAHRHYVALHDARGALRAEALLQPQRRALRADLGAALPGAAECAARFFALGWEHILIGYDHVLFLLALLAAAGSLRAVVAIVTAFTAAHSLTLALASFDLVRLPGGPVEALIAASIVWVAVENVVRRAPRHRWRIAFGFGLVHGFGFASVLRELAIADSSGVAMPLLSFNLGVEAGQLAIAAVAWPLLRLLRSRPRIGHLVAPALSCAVAAVGAWWLLERTLWG
jgi:hypothetical protein